jgi:tetratricopeptide (TPR) repeat protein
MYQGRQWEARALLEGCRLLAEEHNLPVIQMRAMSSLAGAIAHDDVAAALRLERSAIAIARELGRRSSELTTLGNATEDARRTGEWEWALSELDTALQLDIDDTTRLTLRGAKEFYQLLRGRSHDSEFDELLAAVEVLDDHDVAAGAFDLRAYAALAKGDWRAAHDLWLQVIGRSDLNAPYVMPRAAHAAIMAGDGPAARSAIEKLDAIGTRGRAVDADRAAVKAGLAALDGETAAAISGYRTAIAAWRDLGMPFDEAMGILSAVTRLGAEVPAEWIEAARATFTVLEAAPLLALLDAAVGAGRPRSNDRPEGDHRTSPSSVEGAIATS